MTAAQVFGPPGSVLGPCDRCEHPECRAVKAQMARDCVFCGKVIGTFKPYLVGKAIPGSWMSHEVAHEGCCR